MVVGRSPFQATFRFVGTQHACSWSSCTISSSPWETCPAGCAHPLTGVWAPTPRCQEGADGPSKPSACHQASPQPQLLQVFATGHRSSSARAAQPQPPAQRPPLSGLLTASRAFQWLFVSFKQWLWPVLFSLPLPCFSLLYRAGAFFFFFFPPQINGLRECRTQSDLSNTSQRQVTTNCALHPRRT